MSTITLNDTIKNKTFEKKNKNKTERCNLFAINGFFLVKIESGPLTNFGATYLALQKKRLETPALIESHPRSYDDSLAVLSFQFLSFGEISPSPSSPATNGSVGWKSLYPMLPTEILSKIFSCH